MKNRMWSCRATRRRRLVTLAGLGAAPLVAAALLVSGPGLPAGAATAKQVTGNGSMDNPYDAPCDSVSQNKFCQIVFPPRTLKHFLANEFVPAYKCPDNFPYLTNTSYAPYGTALPNGVQIFEPVSPWNVGISITGEIKKRIEVPRYYWNNPAGFYTHIILNLGTATGSPYSSATSYSLYPATYAVVLHCTSDRQQADWSPS